MLCNALFRGTLPLETRLHLATFYALLAVASVMLWLRASSGAVRSLSGTYISPELPILGKRITVGGLAISVWIVGVTLATAGYWIPAQLSFWGSRTAPLSWDSAKIRLTVTGVLGHYADILLGLLVIPVSRNSLMGQVFGLHRGILLSAHKFIAYLFLGATLAHGVAYAVSCPASTPHLGCLIKSWLYALDPSSDGDAAKDEAFATGNPFMTLEESEKRSSWFTKTTYTGAAALIFLIIITLTALPFVRRRFYNVFYYCHIITGICIFIAAGVHASTDFYLLLPGLVLWVVDWAKRLFGGETGGLHKTLMVSVEDAGSGWYRISLPALKEYDAEESSLSSIEEAKTPSDPLTCYYLNFPAISKLLNHAFTAAVSSSARSGPAFLFQRLQGKSQKRLAKEWTWKLAALASPVGGQTGLKARLEGPYGPADRRYETASHIICIGGGTGVTGAHSLAVWWIKTRALVDDSRFTLTWTIRYEEMAHVREWLELKEIAGTMDRLTLVTHVSSQSQRLDPSAHLKQTLGIRWEPEGVHAEKRAPHRGRAAWVYSSGPEGLIRATEKACIKTRREIKSITKKGGSVSVDEINWHMARWEV
ncbi:hypothetical protein ACJ41O_012369 [Fusarium nematophilum]